MTRCMLIGSIGLPADNLYRTTPAGVRALDRLRGGAGGWWILRNCPSPHVADPVLKIIASAHARSRMIGYRADGDDLLLWIREADMRRVQQAFYDGSLHRALADLGVRDPGVLSDLFPLFADPGAAQIDRRLALAAR